VCTTTASARSLSTASTLIAGKPTSSSHMRVGSTSTGALRIGWRREPPNSQSPCAAPGGPPLPVFTPL
jgi:hypothetical protein